MTLSTNTVVTTPSVLLGAAARRTQSPNFVTNLVSRSTTGWIEVVFGHGG